MNASTEVIQILTNLIAKREEFMNHQSENIVKIEAVDMDLPIMIQCIFFKYNSEFRNKFAQVHNRIIESGIDVKWASEFKDLTEKKSGLDDSSNV